MISSRSNFCKSETSNNSHTFPGFNVFVLDKLRPDNINAFLQSKDIDVSSFRGIALVKKVSDLLTNPFYLARLANIYLKENNLPKKAELMEKLVSISFKFDDKKFPGNLEDDYRYLFSLLEKVAFAMQLMQRQSFDDWTEYQEILPDSKDRNLIKKSGLLTHDGTTWSFLHNNFREYLAARYLATLDQEEATTIFSNGKNIKPSWVNTLGYLTGLDLEWDLLRWLAENTPSALVKFEADRLNPEIRNLVFQRIFSKYEERQLHFDDELCDVEEFAHFAKSNEILSFLLDRISHPKNSPSQYNAVNILRHFSSLFGRNEEVKDCLICCCEQHPETHKSVCRLAILALCQLKLHTPEVTMRLMKLFADNQEDYIRFGMYEYLRETGEHNTYVQFFLSGIEYATRGTGSYNSRIGNELFELVRGLKSMSTSESVADVLKWYSQKRHQSFHDSNEVFSSAIDKAIYLCKNGHCELYSIVLECYLHAAKEWNHVFEFAAVKFFINTNTHHAALMAAAKHFEDEPYHLKNLIDSDPSLVDYLATAYSDGSLASHIAFQNIVRLYEKNEMKYKEYAELIQNIDGVEIPNFQPSIDYQALKIRAEQEYFDTLFDSRKRETLFAELLSRIDDPNITAKQLLKKDLVLDRQSALWLLRTEIYHYGANLRVADFFVQIDIDNFILYSAARFLNKNTQIVLTAGQKETLMDMIRKKVESKIFENAITYFPSSFEVKPFVPKLLSLIQYLDFPLDEDSLLNLTEIPAYMFNSENEQTKYQYLKPRLSLNKLKHRLIENVKANPNERILLEDHIAFFDELKDAALARIALEICKKENDNTILRYVAWKYLYNTLGAEYLCYEVLPYANGDLLVEINGACKDIPREQMRRVMEEQYKKTPTLQLQAHLISLDSKMAVSDYVDTVKKLKHPPEGESTIIEGPTEAISAISNPDYLPFLDELLTVVFDSDFVDCTMRGLRGTLLKAFINCGKKASTKTISIIESHRPASLDSNDIWFCNYAVNEIERVQSVMQDLPKTLRETKNLLRIR